MSSVQVAVRIPSDELVELDSAVKEGRFRSRADAIRTGIELLMRLDRERTIAQSYQRGYGIKPQEDWIGEVGVKLGSTLIPDQS